MNGCRASIPIAFMLAAALGGGVRAGVVMDMPPVPVTTGQAAGAPDADQAVIEPGRVALARYASARTGPRDTYGWPVGWYGGWYGPYAYGPYLGGGYRISLSPFQFYGYRAWHGGYVFPGWLYGWRR